MTRFTRSSAPVLVLITILLTALPCAVGQFAEASQKKGIAKQKKLESEAASQSKLISSMGIGSARQLVAAGLGELHDVWFRNGSSHLQLYTDEIEVAEERITWTAENHPEDNQAHLSYSIACTFELNGANPLIQENKFGDSVILYNRFSGYGVELGPGDGGCKLKESGSLVDGDVRFYWGRSSEYAQRFADAVNRLRAAARGDDLAIQPDAWNDFLLKAGAWRALPAKPPLSEEVRQHRIVAEHYVQLKNFDSALQEYEAGLAIDSMWPEGHFNAGLLYAELQYYSHAIFHMNSYLALVPDAPDAQQVRDQVIIWQAEQRKASAASAPASATSTSPSKKKQR
jgi:tetratricopeptide (TPR) repeat protein